MSCAFRTVRRLGMAEGTFRGQNGLLSFRTTFMSERHGLPGAGREGCRRVVACVQPLSFHAAGIMAVVFTLYPFLFAWLWSDDR